MLNVKVQGEKEVLRSFQNMIGSVRSEMSDALEKTARSTASLMRELAPKATGAFAKTIDYDIQPGLVAEVGPDNGGYNGRPVAQTIELGRSAGRQAPPWIALADRYNISIAQAKAAARTIAQKGTPATNFVEKTYGAISRPGGVAEQNSVEATIKIANKF